LNIAGRMVSADKIATAHTLDDEIQTFLLNVIHGDPARIARSEPTYTEVPGLVQKAKPYCEVLERESSLYAYVKGISFQGMPCPYAGEALRNDVRQILNRLEERHSGMKYTIHGSMKRIQQAMRESVKEMPLRRCDECGEPATGTVCQTCQLIRRLEAP